MDDIMNKIQDILGSEEGMQQLKSMAQSLGIDIDEQLGDLSGVGDSKDDGKASGQEGKKPPPDMNFSEIDVDMLLKMQKLLSSFGKEDDNTRLLLALKPHFSDERKVKVDKAIKMLQLISLMPILKEGGLFTDGKQDI